MSELLKFIQERRREKEYDVNWFNKYLRAYSAYFLSYFIWKTKIHHTVITFLGFFMAIASGILFSIGNYWAAIIALILFELCVIADYLDGTLARVRKIGLIKPPQVHGRWLDGMVDTLGKAIIITGISFGAYFSTNNIIAFLSGFILVISLQSRSIMGFLSEKFDSSNYTVGSYKKSRGKGSILGYIDNTMETGLEIFFIISVVLNVIYIWLYISAIYNLLILTYTFIKANNHFKEMSRIKNGRKLSRSK